MMNKAEVMIKEKIMPKNKASTIVKKHVSWKPKHPKPYKENKVIRKPPPAPNNNY